MENQMENEMETGIIGFFCVVFYLGILWYLL